MRVFSVGSDGRFTEYERVPFEADHEESILEEWLESNPDGVFEDGPLLIIGRQVPTDLGKSIDLLGVDREGNVVVVELKRDRTSRDVIAQALEYAAFAAKLDAAALEGILGRVSSRRTTGPCRATPRVLRSDRGGRVQQGPAHSDHWPAGNAGDQADGVVPGGQGGSGHLRRVFFLPGRQRGSLAVPGDRRRRGTSEAAREVAQDRTIVES